jgi:hypothetical protein
VAKGRGEMSEERSLLALCAGCGFSRACGTAAAACTACSCVCSARSSASRRVTALAQARSALAPCSCSRRNHAKQRDPRAPAYATSLNAERSATSRACAASVAAAGPALTRVEAAPPQAPRPGDANRPAPGEAARACALVPPPKRVYGLWRRTRGECQVSARRRR